AFPGLPLIQINLNAGGIVLGSGPLQDVQATTPSTTFADTLSITRGRHSLRTGAELRYYENNFNSSVLARGLLDFANFNAFLAGNAISQYDLPEIPNVSKRVLRSIDPNNFAPRVGIVYSPLASGRMVVRGGYGIFYSRIAFTTSSNSLFSPPFYLLGVRFIPP